MFLSAVNESRWPKLHRTLLGRMSGLDPNWYWKLLHILTTYFNTLWGAWFWDCEQLGARVIAEEKLSLTTWIHSGAAVIVTVKAVKDRNAHNAHVCNAMFGKMLKWIICPGSWDLWGWALAATSQGGNTVLILSKYHQPMCSTVL